MINDISELVPKPVTLYKLEDGVLLEVPTAEITTLFSEDSSWSNRYVIDSKCNTLMYTLDMRILDRLCSLLKNNGLNKLLTKAKVVNGTKDISGVNAVAMLIIGLVLNNNFGNYPATTIEKLKTFLGEMEYVNKQLQDLQLVLNKNMNKSSAIADATAKYLVQTEVFNFTEEFWESISKMLIIIGARINLEECRRNKWDLSVKAHIITEYIIKMCDRYVFSSVYNIKNTFSYYVGTFLTDNNYTADYNSVTFPAYKLAVSDMANVIMSEHFNATVYLHGLGDTKVAAKLSDITTFTALEMLKEGRVSDGETCVVFQQVLYYGG